MASSDSHDSSVVTLVSRRILPSLEDTQAAQDTVALLEDRSLSLSETEEADLEAHEGAVEPDDNSVCTIVSTCRRSDFTQHGRT